MNHKFQSKAERTAIGLPVENGVRGRGGNRSLESKAVARRPEAKTEKAGIRKEEVVGIHNLPNQRLEKENTLTRFQVVHSPQKFVADLGVQMELCRWSLLVAHLCIEGTQTRAEVGEDVKGPVNLTSHLLEVRKLWVLITDCELVDSKNEV